MPSSPPPSSDRPNVTPDLKPTGNEGFERPESTMTARTSTGPSTIGASPTLDSGSITSQAESTGSTSGSTADIEASQLRDEKTARMSLEASGDSGQTASNAKSAATVATPRRDGQSILSFLVLAIGTLIVIWKMHAFKLPSQIAFEQATAKGKPGPTVSLWTSITDWLRPWSWGRGDLLKKSTATGGDMGAHVWSADFVTRGLFPKGRLTGWSDDWMFGIPVLNFYFPLPTLTIGLLSKILGPQIAFKLITALGIFTLPAASWASGKLARLPRPAPTLMGLASFIFLFGRQYDLFIYGGNILSTMAGEFSFSISLSLAVLFLGSYINVLRTGNGRGRTALLLATTGLCHLLPTMWAGLAALILSVVYLDVTKLRLRNTKKFVSVLGMGAFIAFFTFIAIDKNFGIILFGGTLFLLALIDQFATSRKLEGWQFNLPQIRDSLLTLGCGGAVAGFWLLPFFHNLPYSNDMGWEKSLRYVKFLFPFWAGKAADGKGIKPPGDSHLIAVAMIFATIGAIAGLGSLARGMVKRAQGFGNWSPYSGPITVIISTLFGMGLGFSKQTWQAGVLGVVSALVVSFFVLIIMNEREWFQQLALGATVILLVGSMVMFWGKKPGVVVLAALPLVFVVFILAAVNRLEYERWATGFTVLIAACGAIFTLSPQFRLWNARVLPFWFLSILLLAGYGAVKATHGVSTALRWYAVPKRSFPGAPKWGIASAAAFTFIGVGLPLNLVPNGLPIPRVDKGAIGIQTAGKSTDSNQATGWSAYNYKGYEGQPAWPEYRRFMDEAIKVGKEHGCGRAIYEYDDAKLGSFGTTLSPMLLPMWTKGCIGSTEGVYFESSASMPFHWMNASLVTAPTTNDDKGVKKYSGPSNPQRDLPYITFDLARGVKKLQQGGVRYYIAVTDIARTAAKNLPDMLTQVGESGSFTFYQIANSDLVSPLTEEPVLIKGVDQDQYGGWLDVEMEQYKNPDAYPQTIAWSGPSNANWNSITANVVKPKGVRTFGAGVKFENPTTASSQQPILGETPVFNRKPLDPVVVSNITKNNIDITFTVDKIGVPVLVKSSYFPNWEAKGAKGPYRVMPNFMVVIPTQKNVTLHYGYSKSDLLGFTATAFGLLGLFLLHFTRKPREFNVFAVGDEPLEKTSNPSAQDEENNMRAEYSSSQMYGVPPEANGMPPIPSEHAANIPGFFPPTPTVQRQTEELQTDLHQTQDDAPNVLTQVGDTAESKAGSPIEAGNGSTASLLSLVTPAGGSLPVADRKLETNGAFDAANTIATDAADAISEADDDADALAETFRPKP